MRWNVGILMVADAPATSEAIAASIIECVIDGGHRIAGCVYRRVDELAIRTQLLTWISDPGVDLIVACGGIEMTATPRALAPLVTARLGSLDAGGQIARSGSTLVVTLTANATAAAVLEDALKRLDPPRVVVAPRSTPPRPPPIAAQPLVAPAPPPPPIPAPVPRAADMTTGSIARIGDLPPSLDDDGRFVDLRAGKGGLRTLAAVAVIAAAGVVFLGINITKRNQAFLTTPSDAPIASAPPPPPPPPIERAPVAVPVSPPPPVARAATRQPPAPPHVVRAPVATRSTPVHHEPTVTAPPPPLAIEATPTDDDRCDQETCAAHGNERECCTPFRATSLPASLDRTMVANAINGVKAKVLACGASSAVTGLVALRVTVDADGHVAAATVEESPEASLASCVVATIRAASFPRTAAGGSFAYRFEF